MRHTKLLSIAVIFSFLLISSWQVNAQDSLKTQSGNLTEEQQVPIPEGLTAADVLNNYIEAIGGRDAFNNIKDRTAVMRGEMMGQSFSIVIKQNAPDKLKQIVRSGEMKQTIIYNGKNAIQITGKNKKELTGNQLAALKYEAQMNFILNPEAFGVTPILKGIVKIDSIDCYKVEMKPDTGSSWTQYYDINSGLRIKEVKNVETAQGTFQQETTFSNYKEVDGIKFPFSIKQSFGMQTIQLNVSSLKINKGIDDKVFEIPE